jgi:uncharacterized repeat protein (TIGR01451 family)
MNFQGMIEWKKTLGGSLNETPVSYYYNTDGTLIILGTTSSNDNDVSGNHGGTDIWICKLGTDGTIIWQKCFGGSNSESASNIIKAVDGTYVITGSTLSNDGNVTGNHGSRDLWIFDINESGTLQWQISLGGSSTEGVNAKTIQASDGYLYSFTETSSNNGNVSGNAGSSDMWLVKLSSTGTFQWQKCLGGTSVEQSADVKEASNGEIYLVGLTNSTGLPNFHGINNDYSDVYLCRVSTAGTLLFQKCFGGTLSDNPYQIVSISPDGSCVINSIINNGGGDVVGYHGNASGNDTWFLKIRTDGSIQWQRSLGGTDFDGMVEGSFDGFGGSGKVIQTLDQGYLIAAHTESNNGDVSGYHQPSNSPYDSSRADIWIVKLDSVGVLQWQKCLGGYSGDWARNDVLEIGSNDYLVTGYTNSSNGDVETNHGALDAWFVRLGPINTVTGILYIDQNVNGIKDTGEPFYSNATVKTEKPGDVRYSIPYGGSFKNETDTGSYTTSVQLSLPYYNVVPSSHTSSFTTYLNKDSFSFALQPIPGIRDVVINMLPLSAARPGFDVSYKIYYKNVGTDTVTNGQVLLKKDPRLNFLSSLPAISSSNGDTLVWSYSNFKPLDTASITVNFHVPSSPAVNIGDTLTSVTWITSGAADQTPADDTSIVKQIARGALDPNDKYEANEGRISLSFVGNGNYLNYLIRFQNVGTDTAFNIVVKDTLDARLNLSTLQMIAASNSYTFSISGRIITWNFYNVRLPFSSINEPASHGYVAFRIKPNTNLVEGDTIHNTTSIYFDFNLPVKTNDAFTVVQDNFAPLPLTLLSFNGVYKNDIGILYWSTANELNVKKFRVERSVNGNGFLVAGDVIATGGTNVSNYQFQDNLANIIGNKFFYRLKEIDNDGKIKYSQVILLERNRNIKPSVHPNPATGIATVNMTSDSRTVITISVMDAVGKNILKQSATIFEGNNSVQINNLQQLPPGFYSVLIQDGSNKYSIPFIKGR